MAKKAVKKSVARKAHKVVKEKVKATKVKKVEVKVSEPEVKTSEPEERPTFVSIKVEPVVVVERPVTVRYDNCEVVKILESGHTKTHFLCEVLDHNKNLMTVHVPRSLF